MRYLKNFYESSDVSIFPMISDVNFIKDIFIEVEDLGGKVNVRTERFRGKMENSHIKVRITCIDSKKDVVENLVKSGIKRLISKYKIKGLPSFKHGPADANANYHIVGWKFEFYKK
jgi:hypothetical protein